VLGTESSDALIGRVPSVSGERPRRPLLRRRVTNRRVAVQGTSAVVALADGVALLGGWLLAVLRIASKAVLLLAVLAGLAWGGRLAVRHVLASPRFAVREIQIPVAAHVDRDEVLALAGVSEGARLLEVDTDVVASRVAKHPWVAGARVSRQLPATLKIEITERRARAVVTLGSLYLVDESGRPFKRATMEEADGLPVLTGIDRGQYVELRDASEAAFRDALALLRAYGERPERPAVSELNIDTRFGFTLHLLDGGTELRLGRKDFGKKLARLDRIFEAVKRDGTTGAALQVVHLDHLDGTSASGTRIPVRLRLAEEEKKD
jgi:cell division protein FtsQ